MQILIIILCALLACTKVTIQGQLAKENIKTSADAVLSNCLIFAFTTLIFSISVRNGIRMEVLCYAGVFGIFSVLFQIFYARALEAGPFSTTCMLMNLNMVIPVIFSLIVFNEKVTELKVIGVALCLFALFLNTKSDGKKVNLKWLIYVLIAFFSTGAGISITQKVFAKSQYSNCVEQFVFLGYLTAFLITFIMTLLQKKTEQERCFRLSKKNILLTAIIAVFLGAYQYFNTYANSIIDAIVLNPSVCGLVTTFQMISGRVIFKERFTVKQIFSICVGILAIVLISL